MAPPFALFPSHLRVFHCDAIIPPRLRLCVHRSHTQDLAPLLPPQLRADDPVDARPDRLARLVDQNTRIVVEAQDASILPLDPVACAHDDGVADVAALDLVGGGGAGHARGVEGALLLDDADDAVADGGVSFLADDHGALDNHGARVVDAVEHGLSEWGTSKVLATGALHHVGGGGGGMIKVRGVCCILCRVDRSGDRGAHTFN